MALSAEERLITIRVKIKRAKKHLAELEAAAETYRDSYTYVASSGPGGSISQGPPELRHLPIIHFDMLAIAGDVMQNLRSSLDHLMYHLALIFNPNARDEILGRVAFPIGDSLEQYESLRKRKIEGVVEPRAVKFIDELKPYKGGNDALWRLHEMNNIDKHRKLISVGADILCDGDGFEGYYLLKDDNPSFSGVLAPCGKQDAQPYNGAKSVIRCHTAAREALVPALRRITNFVETLIEQDFRIYLE